LQTNKINCHYSKLKGENSYEIYSLVVAEENKGEGYKLNFFLQVREQ